MKKCIILVLIICLVFWMVPVSAMAEQAEITVGETQAEVDTQEETADAQATAASSEVTGDSLGDVSSNADGTTPNSNENASGGPDSVEIGVDTSVELNKWETASSASYLYGSGTASASERVEDITINVPEEYKDEVGEIINIEVISEGSSVATAGIGEFSETSELSYASSTHTMSGIGGVNISDSDIHFDSISAEAIAHIDTNSGSHAEGRAIIVNLQVWDYSSLSYTTPVTVDTNIMSHTETEALRIALNNALINDDYLIEIASLANIVTNVSGSLGDPFADAWATGMVVNITVSGGEFVEATLCQVEAHVDLDTAETYGKEFALLVTIPEAESEEKIEEPVQATAAVIEVAETAEQEETTISEAESQEEIVESEQEKLPYTGASFELIGLLGLALMGAGLYLRRK